MSSRAIALLVLAVAVPRMSLSDEGSLEAPCALSSPSWEETPSATCISCHASGAGPQLHGTHVVDVRYAESASSGYRSQLLRPVEVVLERGVLLPHGEVRCVTCHDPASRWTHRLALPAEATSSEPTPLCTACHNVGQ